MPRDPVYPFDDERDVADAGRGFIAALTPGVVRNAAGQVIWDNDSYSFLAGEVPDTVDPSLWRQSALCAKQGLFEVTEGIYQVRGLDLSNVSFVEGDAGVIVIDPLISVECAAAALGLYRAHRGPDPRRRCRGRPAIPRGAPARQPRLQHRRTMNTRLPFSDRVRTASPCSS